MRLIDVDALREVIENHVTTVSVCPTADWSRGKTEFKKQVLEDIDNAPMINTEPVREWIRVEDRLPEETVDVLLLFPHNMAVGFRKEEQWMVYCGGNWYTAVIEECGDELPQYWTFIPAPPKEI